MGWASSQPSGWLDWSPQARRCAIVKQWQSIVVRRHMAIDENRGQAAGLAWFRQGG